MWELTAQVLSVWNEGCALQGDVFLGSDDDDRPLSRKKTFGIFVYNFVTRIDQLLTYSKMLRDSLIKCSANKNKNNRVLSCPKVKQG